MKKPEFVVSSATAIGLIGLASFYYKKSMDHENEIASLKTHLSSTVKMALMLEKRLNDLERLKGLPTAVQEQLNENNRKVLNDQQAFAFNVIDYTNNVNEIFKEMGTAPPAIKIRAPGTDGFRARENYYNSMAMPQQPIPQQTIPQQSFSQPQQQMTFTQSQPMQFGHNQQQQQPQQQQQQGYRQQYDFGGNNNGNNNNFSEDKSDLESLINQVKSTFNAPQMRQH